MPEYTDGQILDKSELKELRKQGYNVDENKTYTIRFLFNDKWNKAVQPGPFRIKTELLDKLAQDAIDMPWMALPYGIENHPELEKDPDPIKKLYNTIKQYSIGQIKHTVRYPSNNVFGIIEVWPEFVGAVQNNLIPPLVSPYLNVIKEDADGISEAQFLNLQSVPKSGYSAQLTQITSMCKGGIKECMSELALVGASGNLNASRKDPKRFSIIQKKLVGAAMSAPENQITLQSVAKTVEEHGKVLSEHTKTLETISTDVATIKNATTGNDGNNPNPAPNPKGAAGENDPKNPNPQETVQIPKELLEHPGIKHLVEEHEAAMKSLDEIKKERDEEKKKALEQKRKAAAESIVTILIKHNKIEEKNKDAEIKKYLDLQNDDKTPVDLDAIEATLKSVLGTEESAAPTVKGAYGTYSMPDLKGDNTGKPRSNAEILEVN